MPAHSTVTTPRSNPSTIAGRLSTSATAPVKFHYCPHFQCTIADVLSLIPNQGLQRLDTSRDISFLPEPPILLSDDRLLGPKKNLETPISTSRHERLKSQGSFGFRGEGKGNLDRWPVSTTSSKASDTSAPAEPPSTVPANAPHPHPPRSLASRTRHDFQTLCSCVFAEVLATDRVFALPQ
jgi:hypothetical protein